MPRAATVEAEALRRARIGAFQRGLKHSIERTRRIAEALRQPDSGIGLPARFLAKIRYVDGCWIWTGSLDPKGYGRYGVGSKLDGTHRILRPHRFAYERLVGPIGEGLVIDHLCRRRACVNPEHLEPVTNRENAVVRGNHVSAQRKALTHCSLGHAFSEANTHIYRGGRVCRQCHNDRERERRQRARG